jgi:SAM-dependent methyltransferase
MAATSPQDLASRDALREAREAELYDEGKVSRNIDRWHRRVGHVFLTASTTAGERCFESLVASRAVGGRVLEVGCGGGGVAVELKRMGAKSVYGFDISPREIERARALCSELRDVSFGVHGPGEEIEGRFDLIVGRAILHHIDFRAALPKLFARDLAPGGRMLFMEPMSHPMTLAFHRFVRSAHTPDEWPLTPADVRWLRARFGARVLPINLLTFPAGVLSSLLFSCADNPLLRFADRVDRSLERRPRLAARGRQGIVLIEREQ